jgi:hypothetical protein
VTQLGNSPLVPEDSWLKVRKVSTEVTLSGTSKFPYACYFALDLNYLTNVGLEGNTAHHIWKTEIRIKL